MASRLKGLEDTWDIGSGFSEPDPVQRALRAIQGGSATLADFRLVMAKDIRLHQAWVAIKSGYFLQVREKGGEPWAWWPTDVAASIAALPLGVEPRADQVERLLSPIRGWHRGQRRTLRSPADQRAAEFCFGLWRASCTMVVCLGRPDGRPLRAAMSRGDFDNAHQVLQAAGLPLPLCPR
jgi:hypothetical protein